jgi:hypothetical protein
VSDRVAIIHIGTHKTGTTSLQLFFEVNKIVLGNAGILVAQGGRYQNLAGNHQVAWELLGSDTSVHLDELIAELRSTSTRTALLSSEDFSILYARPRALEILRDGIASSGFRPKIVVYLRAQAPYAESMYAERIKHDYVRRFADYLETVTRDGAYVPQGSAIHIEFLYTRLLEPFARVFGKENVVVRPFSPAGDAMHIYRDFVDVVRSIDPAFAQANLNLTVPVARANESLTLYGLLAAAYNACGAVQTIGEGLVEAIRAAAPAISDDALNARFRLLQRDEVVRLTEASASDNERLAAAYGVTLPGAAPADIPETGDPRWELARTHRALYDTLLEAWLTKRDAGRPPQE